MNPKRQSERLPADAGMTLVEVVVALVVFALLSTGIVAAIGTVQRMTADNQRREVATNIAAQDTASVRQITNLAAITSASSTSTVNGVSYTLTRTVRSITSTGADTTCGNGAGLFAMRVLSSVTWTGQASTTSSVTSSTIVAVNGTVNSATTGSIAVYVADADAVTGVQGVSVNVAPASGVAGNTAVAPSSQPALTNSNGCTFSLGLQPGTYTVTISKSGSLDPNQTASPAKTVQVVAGATSPASFSQYGQATQVSWALAGNDTADSPATPSSLPLYVAVAGGGTVQPWSVTATSAGTTWFPYSAGYTVVAGTPATCAAMDPAQWSAGTVAVGSGSTAVTTSLAAGAPGTFASPEGSSVTATVPMGVLIATLPSVTSAVYFTAVSVAGTASGEPGCGAAGAKFTFPAKTTAAGAYALALPYGTWKIYTGSAVGGLTTQLLAANLSVTTNAAVGYGVATDNTVTLDPRATS